MAYVCRARWHAAFVNNSARVSTLSAYSHQVWRCVVRWAFEAPQWLSGVSTPELIIAGLRGDAITLAFPLQRGARNYSFPHGLVFSPGLFYCRQAQLLTYRTAKRKTRVAWPRFFGALSGR